MTNAIQGILVGLGTASLILGIWFVIHYRSEKRYIEDYRYVRRQAMQSFAIAWIRSGKPFPRESRLCRKSWKDEYGRVHPLHYLITTETRKVATGYTLLRDISITKRKADEFEELWDNECITYDQLKRYCLRYRKQNAE